MAKCKVNEVNLNLNKIFVEDFREAYQSSIGEEKSKKSLEQGGYIASGTETFEVVSG